MKLVYKKSPKIEEILSEPSQPTYRPCEETQQFLTEEEYVIADDLSSDGPLDCQQSSDTEEEKQMIITSNSSEQMFTSPRSTLLLGERTLTS